MLFLKVNGSADLGNCADIKEKKKHKGKEYGKDFQIPTYENCREACQKLPNCIGWSFEGNSSLCQLMREIHESSEEDHWISGLKFCGGKSHIKYLVGYQGFDFKDPW